MKRSWRIALVTVVAVVAAVFVLGVAWALVEPYTFVTERHLVDVPNLQEEWYGKRVAVIADFQIGMWLDNVWTMRRIVDEIIREKPQLVLILGDFIYHGGKRAPDRITTAAEVAKPLVDAGPPVHAVLGNHDYSVAEYNPPKIDGLYVVGIGAHMAGQRQARRGLRLGAIWESPDRSTSQSKQFWEDWVASGSVSGSRPYSRGTGSYSVHAGIVDAYLCQRGRGSRRRLDPGLRSPRKSALRQSRYWNERPPDPDSVPTRAHHLYVLAGRARYPKLAGL